MPPHPPSARGGGAERMLGERRGRSVSYLRRWAREEGQREVKSKQTNHVRGRRALRNRRLGGEQSTAGGVRRGAEDVPGAGGSPGTGRELPRGADGRTGGSALNFLSGDGVKKAACAGG